MPYAGWVIKNRHFFPTVLEVGESKIMELADSAFSESPLSRWHLSVLTFSLLKTLSGPWLAVKHGKREAEQKRLC